MWHNGWFNLVGFYWIQDEWILFAIELSGDRHGMFRFRICIRVRGHSIHLRDCVVSFRIGEHENFWFIFGLEGFCRLLLVPKTSSEASWRIRQFCLANFPLSLIVERPPKISQDLLIVEFQNQGGINCLTLPKHPSSLLRFKIIPLRKPIHWITQAHIWLPSATLPIMTRNAWSIVFCISHSSTLDCNEC